MIEAILDAWMNHWGWLWMLIGILIALCGRITWIVIYD